MRKIPKEVHKNNGMNKPLVSIVMPVKNGERYLRQSIESIINQDYPLIELIIIDGQSADSTEEIAKSFEQVRYFRQTEDPGIPQAKNIGISFAKGEFIGFASHDDIWVSNKLSMQLDYMLHNNIDYTITRVKFFLEPGSEVRPGFNRKLLERDYVGKMPETLVTRKTVFDKIGVFSTDLNFMEDIDWFNRAARNNITMAVINEVLLLKRIHDSNTSYDPLKMITMKKEIFRLAKQSIINKSISRT